ncbi:CHAT domain-containing protein [Jiangella sp. DSM 45060]|uniref:CHAT domain-containing protein n=1 Tax=Jiangella sp. DSM 45060 TaxID=1798224 RepID=UPI00087B152A|nr:CHAT domain-containing protein [Jiangella sp. DSM 45060]SDT30721.1 CHAT domain-containing protein [Jiangella sp. DSM 45060]
MVSLRRRPAVDLRVLDGLGAARPVVQVKFVDAGDLYVTWRWEHAPGEPRVTALERSRVQPALDDLARALPSPLPGEDSAAALARALGGPLLDREREHALSTRLAQTLLPFRLAAELNELGVRGVRPHLRVQPSPSTAQVPWEALPGDAGERVADLVDVSVLPPATVRHAIGRRVAPWDPDGPLAAALDPRVPGFPDGSALGSVLGPVEAGSTLAAMADALRPRLRPAVSSATDAFRRDDVDRDRLEGELATAARFLYVGHVTTAEHGLGAALHLSCPASAPGRAAPVGAHRPLTAADLAFGHRTDDPRPWRLPARVALIACESGGDARFAESSGLVAAMVQGGAEHVTAARWPLPTDAGLPGGGLADAVVAVNDAHEAPDPVAAQVAWQRDRAARWWRTGDPSCSPLFWGAFSTAYAPATAGTAT